MAASLQSSHFILVFAPRDPAAAPHFSSVLPLPHLLHLADFAWFFAAASPLLPLLLLGFGPAVLPLPVPQRHVQVLLYPLNFLGDARLLLSSSTGTDGRYTRCVGKCGRCLRHSLLTYSQMHLYSEIAAFSWFVGPAGGILTSQVIVTGAQEGPKRGFGGCCSVWRDVWDSRCWE